MPARFLFLGIAVLGGAAIVWCALEGGRPVVTSSAAAKSSDPVERRGEIPHAPFSALGNSGCAAQGCHGAADRRTLSLSQWGSEPADLNRWRNSSVIFNGHDPHRKAYDSLRNDLSAQIQARLGSDKKAYEDARCLACHSNPTTASIAADKAGTIHGDGVSCESCHGNASGWIGVHTSPSNRTSALAAGLRPLNNIGVRAETCMGCHVGAPANAETNDQLRDMNHDLVAAGHPRLNFDFATYLERLPAHWTEKIRDVSPITLKPRTDAPWYWLVGRYAANEAAYRLLADRAAGEDRKARPWPELAEHDCFSCHRDLPKSPKEYSPKRGYVAGGLGREEPSLLHVATPLPKETAEVEKLMKSGAPSASNIAKKSADAVIEWQELLRQLLAAGPQGNETAIILKQLESLPAPMTWAEACQRFYVLDFLNQHANLGGTDELNVLKDKLKFDREYKTAIDPSTGKEIRYLEQINSPAKIDMELASQKLKAIAVQLSKSAAGALSPKK